MTYFNHSHSGGRKKSQKKSVFGGKVKTPSEIQSLNHAINQKEKKDFEEFKDDFESRADAIWGTESSTPLKPKPSGTVRELTPKEKLMILSRLQLNLKAMLKKQKKNKSLS